MDRSRFGTALVILMVATLLPFPGWTKKYDRHTKSAAPRDIPTGTSITFYGWSRDSRYVAYRWTRLRRRKNRKAIVTIRKHHRLIWKNRLSGFGPNPGRDIAAYTKKLRYVMTPLKGKLVGKDHWQFATPSATYHFRLKAGKRLRWSLWLDDKVLMEEGCNGLYVQIKPILYPSPNGKTVLVLLHQDTGWSREDIIRLAPLPGKTYAPPPHR